MYWTPIRKRVVFIFFLLVLLTSDFIRPLPAQSTTTLRIYLARHGETDWNAEGRLQGDTDTELNGLGRKQAMDLAERLKSIHLDAVYSSTLRRSRDTAEVARGSATLQTLAGLGERRVGKFQGQRVEADAALKTEFDRRVRIPDDDLGGGESLNQFYARVRGALDTILSRHRSGTILIVGHSRTNQMILRSVFGWTADQAIAVDQGNAELYVIELEERSPPRLLKVITEANLGDL